MSEPENEAEWENWIGTAIVLGLALVLVLIAAGIVGWFDWSVHP